MRVGIDLLWVRHGICGGTESVVRNLIHGFGKYDSRNEYVLFLAQDNRETFQEYLMYHNMTEQICPVHCAQPAKRILWENLHLDQMAKNTGVDVMFIPVYSKPRTWGHKIPYICVIYDLQAIHYPQYFSQAKRVFYKYAWRYTCKTAQRIVTASDFCRQDLLQHFPFAKGKVMTIYAPIVSEPSEIDFAPVGEKYGIEDGQYYYCVSSLLPHKNLKTILKAAAVLKSRSESFRLVLSGVGGDEAEFNNILAELGIEHDVVQTGYVSDKERDCLYEHCKLFLFPSIFEGFGMPPVEAMRKGKNVVMTGMSCLREITENKAYYVENPTDVEEWIQKIKVAEQAPEKVEQFERYEGKGIVEQYIAQWDAVVEKVVGQNE